MKKFLFLLLILCWTVVSWCNVGTTDEDIKKLEKKIEYLEDQIEDLEGYIDDVSSRVDEACEYHWC